MFYFPPKGANEGVQISRCSGEALNLVFYKLFNNLPFIYKKTQGNVRQNSKQNLVTHLQIIN